MGTNFYLRERYPHKLRDVLTGEVIGEEFDRHHIAKRSAGWVIHFEAYPYRPELYGGDDDLYRPRVESVADIRALIETGEWVIEDEYGEAWEDDPMAMLDELCAWRGGGRFEHLPPVERDPLAVSDGPHGPYYTVAGEPYEEFTDPEGYRFGRYWFR